MSTERRQTVYHVELKDPHDNEKKHTHFGSQAAIFQTFGNDRLGISYRSLANNYNLSERDYENKKCIIRKGYLRVSRKISTFAK